MSDTVIRTSNGEDGSGRSRVLPLVAVVVMVVLAGCGGGGGGTPTDAPPGGTDTPTETPAGPTATPTDAPPGATETPTRADTPTPTPRRPDTPTPTQPDTPTPTPSETLPNDAGRRHVEALRNAGSFTSVWETTYSNASGPLFSSRTEARLDPDAGSGYQNTTLFVRGGFRPSTTDIYTTGDTTYQRFGTGDNATYLTDTEPYDTGQVTPVNFDTVVGEVEENFSEGIRFERDGETTYDGVPVTRYRANDEDLAELWNTSDFGNATVTGGAMTLLVDDRGIFRQFELRIDLVTEEGEQVTVEVVQTFTAVGSTTVPEPPWLDEARAQTG